ncbi:MAG: hypothetical protein BYD32DRAFT_433212 [Podila humilis]|nr:MAG: hypothetical protein BYD32DRAFT_433212 [Podila humilis]
MSIHIHGSNMSTSGASGALTAMHDAVALSNWIYTLQSSSASDISAIFYEYHVERHPIAKEVFEASEIFSKLWDKGSDEKNAGFFVGASIIKYGVETTSGVLLAVG